MRRGGFWVFKNVDLKLGRGMADDGRSVFGVLKHEPKTRCYQDMGTGTCRRTTFMHASVVLLVFLSSLSGGEHHHRHHHHHHH